MGFVFAVRRGCLELALEVGRFSERTRFKRSSESIRARSHALRFITLDVGLEFSGGEDEVSLSHREGSAKFPEVSLPLLCIPLSGDWWHTVFSFASRTKQFLKHVLYCLLSGMNRYPLGRLLNFSDNHALVSAFSREDAQKKIALLSFMRRIFAFGFWAVRVEIFRQGKSFFLDCDYDTSRSLLHVLAQRLRSSPSPTCDQTAFSFC